MTKNSQTLPDPPLSPRQPRDTMGHTRGCRAFPAPQSTLLGSPSGTYTYDSGRLSQLDRKTFREGAEQHQYYSFSYNLWGQSTSIKVGTIPLATYEYADISGNPTGSGGGLLRKMTYGNGNSVTSRGAVTVA